MPYSAEELRLRRTEAAHHRAAVEVALDEAARAERDRDAGEDRGEQRGQAEEALRAVDRGAHLGPAGFQVVHALAALQLLLHFIRKLLILSSGPAAYR